jgi:hypothetical protein
VRDRIGAAGPAATPGAKSAPTRLSHEDIEAIAAAIAQAVTDRVLDLIDARQANRLVDAVELADILSDDRDWTYQHRHQLGAIGLGDGPRPRLRFEVDRAVAAFKDLSSERRVVPLHNGPQAPVPRPRRSRGGRR